MLPQRLREKFGLDDEALFAGMGERFQIWAPEAYRRRTWRRSTTGAPGSARTRTRSRCSTRWTARTGHDDGAGRPHVPVLLAPILARGGAGRAASGSTAPSAPAAMPAALLEAGAARVIGIDRDPEALARAAAWAGELGGRLELRRGALRRARPDRGGGGRAGARRRGARHRRLVDAARPGGARLLVPEGRAARHADEPGGADGGRPRQPAAGGARSPTSSTSSARSGRRGGSRGRSSPTGRAAPFETTLQLAGLIERLLPRPKPGQPHAATRSFQALRIAVNDELGELARGLAAAEAALAPGGWLAVVTFHSLEDRIVKRFLALRSGARAARQPARARGGRRGAALRARHPQGGGAGRGRGRGQPAGALGEAPDRAAARRAGRARSTRGRSGCRRWRWRSAREARAAISRPRCWWWSAPPGPTG